MITFNRFPSIPLVAVGSLAVLLTVSACGSAQVTRTNLGAAQAVAAQPATGLQAPAAAAPQQVTMSATEFKFSPNIVQLTVGRPVQLTITNVGSVDHDVKSDMPIRDLKYVKADNDASEQQDNAAQGVLDVDFSKGDTSQVTFVPTQAGTYSFYCDEPGHKDGGMVGTFLVQG